MQDLNAYKQVTSPITSTLTSRIFAVLFPSTPAVNALLATLYISGPPNFLLALCPPNIDPASLSVMVAFAVGGLLGDTLFHLLPEIFLGEDSHENVRFVLVEPNRNLLLGVAIMVGFVTFVAMDKGLRIATGGQGHEHSHSHGHDSEKETSAISSNLDDTPARSTRSRKKDNGKSIIEVEKTEKEINSSVKLAGYLNLMYVLWQKKTGTNANYMTARISPTTLPTVSPCPLPFMHLQRLARQLQLQYSSTKFPTKSVILLS